MKKLTFGLLLVTAAAFAAPPSTSTPSQHKQPPFLKSPPHVQEKKPIAPPPKLIIPADVAKKVTPTGDYFNHPGVVASKGGEWIGGDNFTNISHEIALQVNIVKPDTLEVPFKREDIQAKIAEIFSKSDITINTAATEFEPPLPFFNLLLLAYPITDGMVVAVQGRLFESVQLKRINLDKNTLFQAITWEQTNLIVAPEEEVEAYVKNGVENIINSFTGRVASAPPPEKR